MEHLVGVGEEVQTGFEKILTAPVFQDIQDFAEVEESLIRGVEQRRGRGRGRKRGGAVNPNRTVKIEAKVKAKRGRPKGSKNKSKVVLEVPAYCSDGEIGEEGASSWARSVWKVGKELGVVYNGDDDVMISRLEDQVRFNHPELQQIQFEFRGLVLI